MMPPALTPGDLVRVRGVIWRLRNLTAYRDCRALELAAQQPGPWGTKRVLLVPFDRPEPLPSASAWRAVPRRAWMRALAALLVASGGDSELHAPARARIELLPYQLEPALSVVFGLATRVLIADAVGLGKTIQAALVLAELAARGECERALILTPSGLRDQWVEELHSRFAIEPAVADGSWLGAARARWPASVNPWALPGVLVSSLDFVKRPENLRAVKSVTWDLLVIDEAHVATPDSDRGAAARAVAGRARRVLLLSATPHSGDRAAFASLCATGAAGPGDPVVMFRRTRADVGLPATRRVHLLRVRPTRAEIRMHRQLEAYATRVWFGGAPADRRRARLAMVVLLKRAFSSAASLGRSLEHRRSHLGGTDLPDEVQLRLPLDVDEDDEDAEPVGALDAPGLDDPSEEDRWLRRLFALARAASRRESKLRAIVRLATRTSEPIVVFTEYRDTLARLAAVLEPVSPCAVLHGGLDRLARLAALREFEEGGARILLATDVGGQGLNLQRRCRLVVNMELPWNPMRVEQRIGRVDRIGQSRTVHAVHLVARGTREGSILARLAERLERVRREIGSLDAVLGTYDEATVADALLRNAPIDAPLATPMPCGDGVSSLPGPGLRAEAREACAGAAARRRWISAPGRRATGSDAAGRGSGDDAVLVTRIRRRRLPARQRRPPPSADTGPGLGEASIVCICRARLVDRSGRLVETLLVPIAGAGRIDWPERSRDLLASVRAILERHGPDMLARASLHAKARAEALPAARQERAATGEARERAIAGHAADKTAAACLLQPGLFDARATREAAHAAAERDARAGEAETRLAALSAATDVSLAAEPDLVLVLAVAD